MRDTAPPMSNLRFFARPGECTVRDHALFCAAADLLSSRAVIMIPGRDSWGDGLLDVRTGLLWESPAGDDDSPQVQEFASVYNSVILRAQSAGEVGSRDFRDRISTLDSIRVDPSRSEARAVHLGLRIENPKTSPFIVTFRASGIAGIADIVSTDRRTRRRVVASAGVSLARGAMAFLLQDGLRLAVEDPGEIWLLDLVDCAWLQRLELPHNGQAPLQGDPKPQRRR